MTNNPKRWLLLGCFCALLLSPVTAQVYPGDANFDGRINHFDILSIGYAYGSIGPARIQDGTESGPLAVALYWDSEFPNGVNFANADANGNGQVEITDFAAVFQNYGQQWDPDAAAFTPTPTPADAPRLGIGDPNENYTLFSSQGLILPINLGSSDQVITDLNGVAFRISYNPDHFASVSLNLANNWLAEDTGQAFSFQQAETDYFEAAITRFGVNPISGSGELGTLSFIIVDDVIDLLPNPTDTMVTCLYIEDLLGIDSNHDSLAIQPDTLCLSLYDINAINRNRDLSEPPNILINPNPNRGHLYINSEDKFWGLDIVDMRGASTPIYRGEGIRNWQGNLPTFASGCYVLRLYADQQVWTKKIIIVK